MVLYGLTLLFWQVHVQLDASYGHAGITTGLSTRSLRVNVTNNLISCCVLFIKGGVQGLTCFLSNVQRPLCDGTSFEISGESRAEVRRCCIDRNGLAFILTGGDENCNLCIGEYYQ